MRCLIDRRRFLALAGAMSLSPLLSRAAWAETSEQLTFGFQNTSWGAVGMVAEAEKCFSKAGADVAIYKFDSGKAVRDAMIASRIDIGVLGTTPMIVGAAKGEVLPLAMVMYAGKTNAIVVGKHSNITSVAGLKGKKVASQLGSATNQVFVDKILPKYGLRASDIRIVNTKFENQVAALVSGSVDAFAGVEPFPSVAEIDGLGTVLVDYSKFDMVPVWLGINRPVLEKKSAAVNKFLQGWLAAVNIFDHKPERATQIVLDYFRNQGYTIKDSAIKLMLSKFDVNPDYVPGLKAYLHEQSELLVKQKQISSIPDWNTLLDAKYLKRAEKA